MSQLAEPGTGAPRSRERKFDLRSEPDASMHVTTLRDYLRVVRRRKWLILSAVVVVPVAAFLFALRQEAMYRASAQVLLSDQNLSGQLTGTQAPAVSSPTELQTQAQLARVPAVAQRAINTLHLATTPTKFLASTSASASATSNIITFSATAHVPESASRMATAYARAYVRYRFAAETAPIVAAQAGLATRIKVTPPGALRNTLIEKQQTLEEMAALKTSDASVVSAAGRASQTAPRMKRDVALGVVLGLLLGIGLAFGREELDTRVRSAEAIGDGLKLPLLARLPEPPKKLREQQHLAMLDEPAGTQAEAFRMLRSNVEFATLGKEVQTLMVTSAVEKEGKSTTIANLAVALARAGQRVALVDLDLRRPFVARFFGLQGHAGLTSVAVGHVDLDEALVSISLDEPPSSQNPSGSVITGSGQVRIVTNGNGRAPAPIDRGSLSVLTSGPIPPDPGEFVGTARLTEILEGLRQRVDLVLIDAPPLFHVGDALALSAKVDGVLVVTRMEVMRRPMLGELRRLLDTMPAAKLGFVVTGAESEESYGYGYGGYYYHRPYGPRVEGEVEL